MQPYLFPYRSYFSLLSAVDTFVLLDDVNFIKKGFIHRNYFEDENGIFRFGLKLNHASQNRKINEHKVYSHDFTRIMNFCESHSSRSLPLKFLSKITDQLKKSTALSDLIETSIRDIAFHLSLDTQIIRSSDLTIDPTVSGQGRIIEICKQIGGTRYLNPIGGKDLYSLYIFENQNIELLFHQLSRDSSPRLSILSDFLYSSSSDLDYEIVQQS